MYITPDNKQIQEALEQKHRSLMAGVVSFAAAAVFLAAALVSAYLIRQGSSTWFYCVMCGCIAAFAVLIMNAVQELREASGDMGSLVAADTFLSLENGIFSARSIYKNMYESCSVPCSEITAVAVPAGKTRMFLIRVADTAENSFIFADDIPVDEKVFLADGQKYKPEEFGGLLSELVETIPRRAQVSGVPDRLPEWPVKKDLAKRMALGFVVVAAATAIPAIIGFL